MALDLNFFKAAVFTILKSNQGLLCV